jgi:hypothetical protein
MLAIWQGLGTSIRFNVKMAINLAPMISKLRAPVSMPKSQFLIPKDAGTIFTLVTPTITIRQSVSS